MNTNRINFDCPKNIIAIAKEKNCEQIAVIGKFRHDIPENQDGGIGAYHDEVPLDSKVYIGLKHVVLSPGYGAAIWGKVIWVI